MAQRTNRHGIPIYPQAAAPPPLTTGAAAEREATRQSRPCCWPGCAISIRPTDRCFPMCVGHAYTMYEIGRSMERDPYWALTWKTTADERFLFAELLKQRTAAAKPKGDQPGYIYFALIDGQIKIGYATRVRNRMKNYPPTTVLLAVHPGTLDLERSLHNQFREHLRRGREWFADCAEIRAYCARVVEQYPDPERYEYKFGTAQPMTTRRAS